MKVDHEHEGGEWPSVRFKLRITCMLLSLILYLWYRGDTIARLEFR